MFVARYRLFRGCLGKGTALLLLVPLLLNGCAGLPAKSTQVEYYPACYAPISKLREENKKFVSTVAAGVIIGGLIGAGLGLAIGGGRGAGAAIGAISGMAGGALAGYAIAKQQKIKDDQARRASIAVDIDGDITSMDSIALASIQARQCYTAQFDAELARYKKGEIGKAEFLSRAREIVSGLNEIAALLKSSESGAQDRLMQYKSAVDAEYKKAGQEVPPLVAEKRLEPEPVPAPEPATETTSKPKKGGKHKPAKTEAVPQQPDDALAQAKPQPAAQTQCATPQLAPRAPLPEANSLEGGAKRCDVMAGLRDELKTESDLAVAKASDCQRITQEIDLEMKTEWLPGGAALTDLAPPSPQAALCPRPRG